MCVCVCHGVCKRVCVQERMDHMDTGRAAVADLSDLESDSEEGSLRTELTPPQVHLHYRLVERTPCTYVLDSAPLPSPSCNAL